MNVPARKQLGVRRLVAAFALTTSHYDRNSPLLSIAPQSQSKAATSRGTPNWRRLVPVVCILLFATASGQNKTDYVKSVEPIVEEKCIACHNHTTRSGGLNLESFEALMNGGRRGTEVIAGNSAQSRLVQMIEGTVEPRMPLGGQLTASEIKTIKDWIDGLAPPGSAAVEATTASEAK